MPRGRPKKKIEPDPEPACPAGVVSDAVPAPAFTPVDIPGLPPTKVDGEWNPEYFATMLDMANRRGIASMLAGEKFDFPFAQFQKSVMDQAKICGISDREVLDRRTETQRAEDLWKKITEDPENALGDGTSSFDEDLKALDRVIAAKLKAMNAADSECLAVMTDVLDGEDAEREGSKSPKAWRRRIQRILRLRIRARLKVPPTGADGGWGGNQYTNRDRPGLIPQALEAAHPLRFMIYVGRVGVALGEQFAKRAKEDPESLIFDVGRHHARFCCHLWMHRTGTKPVYDRSIGRHVLKEGVCPYQGTLQVMPVGFGKTELAVHYAALEIGLRPRVQAYYVHAKHERAKQNVGAIKRFFDPNTGIGRRYLSIFPAQLDKKDNDATHIRVRLKNPPKSPTFTAAGVDSAELGGDADFQIWDDVVPRSDVTEETTRKQRFDVLASTFLTRQRGRNAFVLVIGTFWHHGDALMTIKNKVHEAVASNGQRGMMYGVLVQKCGGPKPTTSTKAWESLWPRLKGVHELKMEYGKLGPSLYSAVFMANPLADEQRIVKKIRLYDPNTPEHLAFVENSKRYISLDPAATKNSQSDKAGIVYAGFGVMRVTREVDGMQVSDTEKRVRLLDCQEIHATQSDLTEYTINFALRRPVDYVIVEAVGGFIGIVEMFQNQGIDAIRKDPRGKNKEQRLRAVAPILEDANAEQNFRAVCEFPCVYEDGKQVLDPRFKNLAEQVLDFGVCAADHCVDALTYLLGELSPDLGIGRGIVTEHARRIEQVRGDPRVQAIVKRIMGGSKSDRATEDEENEWVTQNWH